MGDRGNIVIHEQCGGRIYLYTHWGGTGLPLTLQSALRRGRPRWNDESYLTRIIFSEMIQHDVLDETGYGISTYCCDQNHPHLIVDIDRQKVAYADKEWTFDEFVTDQSLDTLSSY